MRAAPSSHDDERTISAQWRLDRAYYRRMWDDLIANRLRFRKWCVPIGIALGVLGVGLILGSESRLAQQLGILAALVGGIHIAWHFWDKAQWFRRVVGDAADEVFMEFRVDGVYQRGPTSEGTFSWRAVQEIVRGEDGLFLGLQRGLSIYVPSSALHQTGDLTAIERWFRESRTPKS